MTRHDEAGVTLIELLVALVVTSAIVLAMTGAIIIGFRTTATSDERLSQNRDIQLVQGIFPQDVMGADQVRTDVAGAANCTGSTALLVLNWSTPTLVPQTRPGPPVTTLTSYEVDYIYAQLPADPPDPATGQLVRRLYRTAGTQCTLLSTRPLASSVSATVTPTVSIDTVAQTVTLTVTDSSGNKYVARAKERSS